MASARWAEPSDPRRRPPAPANGGPWWEGRPALAGGLALAWLLTWARHRLLLAGAMGPDLGWWVAVVHALLAVASLGAAAALRRRAPVGHAVCAAIGLAHLGLGFFVLDLFGIPGQPAETIVLSMAHRLAGLHLAIGGWLGARSAVGHV